MGHRRSLRQAAEQIVILAKDLVGGFFKIGINGILHIAVRLVRMQRLLQKVQNLLLFFQGQFTNFVDDFNRTHVPKLTEFCDNSKLQHWEINELDKPVFAGLGERHVFSQSQLSFDVCEDLKKSLYNLKKAESKNIQSNGKYFQLNLGSTEDFQFVDDVAKKFAVAVWEKISAAAAIEFPERVFLTGGGSLILPVASALTESATQSGIRIQNVRQNNEDQTTDVWRPWNQTGESLQRLATALGGCNVILQASSGMEFTGNAGLQPRPPIILNPPTGFKTCRCRGNGNHDCCFCGGRGFVEN